MTIITSVGSQIILILRQISSFYGLFMTPSTKKLRTQNSTTKMETHQPLLESQKISSNKTVYLILSITAIIVSITLFSVCFTQPTSFIPSLPTNICEQAQDKKSCLALVLEVASNTSSTKMNRAFLLNNFLKQSITHIQKALEMAKNLSRRQFNNPKDQAALLDCIDLIDLSLDRVNQSITSLQKGSTHSHEDAHAWLSGVLTNYVTCFDGLEDLTIKTTIEPKLKDLISRARTSLAMIVTISPSKKNKMFEFFNGDFPTWISRSDRRLLEGSIKEIKANVVVAKDGSGNYKTVKEAVEASPSNSKTRYVIYVKKGIYNEKVEIGSNKKNLMIVGDGMHNTVITGSLNVVDGSTTFNSATVVAVGDGFIAQDIWFQNTAGPEKHQAVALRVGADQSVINRCRIDAYQDTLYTHTNRQFYRDSSITGTVDFIFGNAAVVFQNCKIIARKPMSGQNNMVTAQGREDPNQNTGTSIQKCEIIASSDLEPIKSSVRTYLGRPWKEYSRTVVMQSNIGDHIDPSGWSVWSGEFALKTLYYGEYANQGAGAGVSKRVKWPGYHVITNPAEAKKFTVSDLIQGGFWLKSTGVAYTEGL